MRVHITAVSGTGMGSLAGLLKELGHEVSGSDTAFYPPMGPALKTYGIRLHEGFSAQHLEEEAPDLVVIGNVCRRDNPEAVFAQQKGIPLLHIGDALGRFALSQASPLVVTGTHGKTTTSSLCAHLLETCGFDPGYFIGGVVRDRGRGFKSAGRRSLSLTERPRLRKTPFVLEGDEYDTAFWEKTAKFLHYQAEVAILTSVEHDHVDIYPSFSDYRGAFERFIENLPEDGLLMAFAADPVVVELSQKAKCQVAYYGIEGEENHGLPVHWLAAPALTTEAGTSFDLYAGGMYAGRHFCPLPGLHNLRNATAALGVAAQAYGAPLPALLEALGSFSGVKRRQELVAEPRGIKLIDDFAHHPTAVKETLAALRSRYPNGQLFCIFEPRSATACRSLHQAAYAEAFDHANQVLLAPLGRRNIAPEQALDTLELARALRARGIQAEATSNLDEILLKVGERAKPGDVVAVFSNGDFGGILSLLESRLQICTS